MRDRETSAEARIGSGRREGCGETRARGRRRTRPPLWRAAAALFVLGLALAGFGRSFAQEPRERVEAAYGWALETAASGVGVATEIVDPSGAAAAAGLATGDVILAIDGAFATSADAFIAALDGREVGATAALVVLRGGVSVEVELPIADLAAVAPAAPRNSGKSEPLAGGGEAPEIIGAPQLVIDTGGHSGQVEGVAFTVDGRYLISAGEDKAIRVWDWREGRTVRILRGAIGEGGEGKILAMALSPDGETIAVAGRFDPDATGGAGSEDGRINEYVRLFAFETGEVVRLVGDVREIITALAFSPDGAMIATGAVGGDVQIWDAATGRELLALTSGGDVYSVAFTSDGARVVAGGIDGSVTLWSATTGEQLRYSRAPTSGVFAVAVSPRGDVFATGEFNGDVRLWRASDGAELGALGNIGGDVGALVYSRDGSYLVATCAGGGCIQRQSVFHADLRAYLYTLGGHTNVVIAAAAYPKGRLVATAGGDNFEILIWDPVTGGVVSRLEGAGGSVWTAGVSADGARIGWGRSVVAGAHGPERRPIEFAFALPVASGFIQEPERVSDPEAFIAERRRVGARRVELSRGGPESLPDAKAEIYDGDRVVGVIERSPFNGYDHRAVTFTPDGAYLFSGGSNGVLEKYSVTGELVGELIGHTSDIWSVSITPDGRLLVSSSADQTLRVWNAATLELVVTLFQTTDGRWIMWTPQGYYDGSPDAGEMIGWALSRGPSRSALYVSAAQLGTTLYRPQLVARALELGSAVDAIDEARREQTTLRERGGPAYRPLPFDVADLLRFLPPNIREVADWRVTPDGRALMTIVVRPNGAEIERLEVFVGDRSVTAEPALTPPEVAESAELAEGEALMSWRLPIAGGRNEIVMRAASAHGVSDLTDRIIIDLPSQFTGRLDRSGRLRVLAIGVDRYEQSSFADLEFAGADARAFADLAAEVMAAEDGEVEVRLLTNGAGDDGEPTKAEIEAALDWIADSKDGDTTVVFIAGHGDLANGEYFILPTDFRQDGPADLGDGRLAWTTVREALTRARGRKIVFLDACRSGAASYYQGFESDAQTHRYVAFSSTSTDERGVPQRAYEDPALGHGVFTYAVLEGLRGQAFTPGSERMTAFNLMSFISSKVYDLSDGRQAPSLGGSGNFLLIERRN